MYIFIETFVLANARKGCFRLFIRSRCYLCKYNAKTLFCHCHLFPTAKLVKNKRNALFILLFILKIITLQHQAQSLLAHPASQGGSCAGAGVRLGCASPITDSLLKRNKTMEKKQINDRIEALMRDTLASFHFERVEQAERKLLGRDK